MKKIISILIIFWLAACVPPPAQTPSQPSNKLGEGKWGEMKYQAN